MNLEKLKELRALLHKLQFDYYDHGTNMHTIVPDSDIKNIMQFVESICQQEIDDACKRQREADAEIFKGYCTLTKREGFAYEDDFNIYCKILANEIPKEFSPSPKEK